MIFKFLLFIAIIGVAWAKPQQQPVTPNYPHNPLLPNQIFPVQQYPSKPIAFEGKSCLHTVDCDAANTVLSCEKGKCTCPNRPQMQWTRGPHPLNTAWDTNLGKCLSLKDSACDVFNPKVVFCGPGLECKKGGAKDGFGVCGSFASTTVAFPGLMFLGILVQMLVSKS